MLAPLDVVTIPLAMLGTGYLTGIVCKRFRRAAKAAPPPTPDTATPGEILEDGIAVLMARLEPELGRLHGFAPGFTGLVTETALSVLVLEYVLRDKGLIEPGEMQQALRLARATAGGSARLGGVRPAGRA